MRYIKLIKLLYLADRVALIETGMPITGDRYVSMKHGPVLSRVLDLVKDEQPSEDSVWHHHIERRHFLVHLCNGVDSDRLSDYDAALLEEIAATYGHWRPWAVVNFTHSLPEWKDPGSSSLPIDPADILRFAGFDDYELELALDQAAAVFAARTQLVLAE